MKFILRTLGRTHKSAWSHIILWTLIFESNKIIRSIRLTLFSYSIIGRLVFALRTIKQFIYDSSTWYSRKTPFLPLFWRTYTKEHQFSTVITINHLTICPICPQFIHLQKCNGTIIPNPIISIIFFFKSMLI